MYMPLPASISYFWNLGSILGLLMGLQLLSGFMLSLHYVSSSSLSFSAVINIMMDVDSGSMLRYMHCNGSSLLFLMVYLHMFKGMYYNSYDSNKWTWLSGCVMYMLLMMTAFLGYVLPWGQMSYWGATVISSLITTIPNVGKWLLMMVWGDYSVSNGVLNRFFALHFLIPFIVMVMVLLHLILLHNKGSTTLISHSKTMLPFTNYFMMKDLVGFIIILMLLMINVYYCPNYFLDSENSIMASPMVTPIHIVPEWYFLFAYCILKSIEGKVLGVWYLIMSVMVFPLLGSYTNMRGVSSMVNMQYYKSLIWHKLRMVMWLMNFCMLTYLGSVELTPPYTTLMYFCIYIHFLPSLLMLQLDVLKWIYDVVIPAFGVFLIYLKNYSMYITFTMGYISSPNYDTLKACCLDINICECWMYHLYYTTLNMMF